MEKTSLDDFVASNRATESGEETEGEAEPSDEQTTEKAGDAIDASAVPAADIDTDSETGKPELPVVTASWSAQGEPCSECGEPSAWQWAQDDVMVCPECKRW